jgi:chromosome segregation ATPase
MITNLRRQGSARTSPMQASIRRPSSAPGIRDAAMESASDGSVEHTLQLATLEAEVLRLRQNLTEVTTSRAELRKEMDDLRRDRDHWRKLAEPAKPKLEGTGQKIWFCGRASASA